MKALAFSPAAAADLEHIWDHSAGRWGPDQADRYIDEIRDACLGLIGCHEDAFVATWDADGFVAESPAYQAFTRFAA